ncbi:MAG TPA: tRNA (adenosine(37)-N6)-threonylcarbamoyltransferase complex ATPase subunit type 1 TsaE [Flavipsychrobacter sp.]|nr:tRNA (adenosine(37)-N6)-threonylcarbamoyltransferase complex ATPase subunit type 1 TsaE [Flavipsychrobacter sp.]
MKKLFTISYSLENIGSAVTSFWQQAGTYRVMALEGDLGAGKTTFIHALCQFLGVKDAVSSPTFSLINEYLLEGKSSLKQVYHMDWYRVDSEDEAIQAGMEDALKNPEAYCFVEWAEKAKRLLPKPYLTVKIIPTAETERVIEGYLTE